MPRPEKVQAVAEIREQLEGSSAVFLTEYRGIAVKQMSDLRRRLRDAGADFKVVKMTLAKRAADDLGLEGLSDELVGPSALAFANDDPVRVAKALTDYSKENDRLVIKLGLMAGKVLRPEEVAKLAEIEPREVLLAKIAGAAKAPLIGVASMLSSFTRDAASMFSALLDKKEADPQPAGAESQAGVESAESEDSPDSPDSAESAESEDSPESADSPENADSPESADSPDSADSAEGEEASAETETEEPGAESEADPAPQAEEE